MADRLQPGRSDPCTGVVSDGFAGQKNPPRVRKAMKLRYEVMGRDNFRCVDCGKTPKEARKRFEVHHLVMVSRWGAPTKRRTWSRCALTVMRAVTLSCRAARETTFLPLESNPPTSGDLRTSHGNASRSSWALSEILQPGVRVARAVNRLVLGQER